MLKIYERRLFLINLKEISGFLLGQGDLAAGLEQWSKVVGKSLGKYSNDGVFGSRRG